MKILVLANTEVGGEWIATQRLIEILKKKYRRLKICLVSLSKSSPSIKRSLFEAVVFVKTKSHHRPFKYYREFFDQLISGKKSIFYISKRHKFDYIIASDYSLAVSYLLSQKKIDYLYFFHGIRNNYKIFSDTFNHYLVLKKLLEMFAWTMSKKIIVPSKKTKDFLINNYGFLLKNKPFLIVPNLIQNEFAKKYSPTEINQLRKSLGIKKNKIILYSGRLVFNKGIENLVAAFLRIEAKYPKITLIIAYPDGFDRRLINQIKTLIGRGKKIILMNNLTTINLARIYQTSALAVLPSPFEISSLFIREALISNLPIISTDTGDAKNILSRQFIIKNNKIDTLYNKIDNFLNNERKYKRDFLKMTTLFKFQYNEEKIINNFIKTLRAYEK